MSFNVSEASTVSELIPRPQLIFKINVMGYNGAEILDSTAKQSVAGSSLHKILKEHHQTFINKTVIMNLADVSSKTENVLLTKANFIVKNWIIPTTFVIIPGGQNRTLRGVDYSIEHHR